MRKDGNDEKIDEKAACEGNGTFNEIVKICLRNILPTATVNASTLDQCRMALKKYELILILGSIRIQVKIVGHYDGANNAHSLEEFFTATSGTIRNKCAFNKVQ
jgi:hypothetical protein